METSSPIAAAEAAAKRHNYNDAERSGDSAAKTARYREFKNWQKRPECWDLKNKQD